MRPLVCNYYVTFRCESTCEFCGVWQNEKLRKIPEADLGTVEKNILQLKKLGVPVLNITGGEPMLREDIGEILRFAKRQGFFTVITTGGQGFADIAKSVVPFADHLLFSLDAPEPAEHDRIRGTGCYQEVMEGIRISKSLGKLPFINFTVTRDTVAQLPEMVDLAAKLGILLWINPVYNYKGLEGFNRETLGYIRRYYGRKNVGLNLAGLELIKRGGNDAKKPVCRAGSATVTLLPDGTLVAPCYYYQKFSSGGKGDIAEVFRGKDARHAASLQGKGEPCRGCMAWSYMNPSFLRGINRYLFPALFSLWSFFWKEIKLRKEVLK